MHQGVLTFRYRGESEVSRVAYQVSQETCHYFQFDAWGTGGSDSNSRRRHRPGCEHSLCIEAKSPAACPSSRSSTWRKDYPGLNPASFGSEEDIAPRDMTVYGVLIRGVHYSGGCETRHGRYPYCDEMPLPSYSLAKTVMAGFALMRRGSRFTPVRGSSS